MGRKNIKVNIVKTYHEVKERYRDETIAYIKYALLVFIAVVILTVSILLTSKANNDWPIVTILSAIISSITFLLFCRIQEDSIRNFIENIKWFLLGTIILAIVFSAINVGLFFLRNLVNKVIKDFTDFNLIIDNQTWEFFVGVFYVAIIVVALLFWFYLMLIKDVYHFRKIRHIYVKAKRSFKKTQKENDLFAEIDFDTLMTASYTNNLEKVLDFLSEKNSNINFQQNNQFLFQMMEETNRLTMEINQQMIQQMDMFNQQTIQQMDMFNQQTDMFNQQMNDLNNQNNINNLF